MLVDEVDRELVCESMSGNNAEENGMCLGIVGRGVRHVVDVRKLVVFSRRQGTFVEASIVERAERKRHDGQ